MTLAFLFHCHLRLRLAMRKIKGSIPWPETQAIPPGFDAPDFPTVQDLNVPDWRDKEAYPKVLTTLPIEWAWHFWCRNPHIRMAWREGNVAADPMATMPKGWRVEKAEEVAPIYLDFKIDITQPLAAQFKTMRSVVAAHPYIKAKSELTAKRKIRPSHFPLYLRLIDARYSGAGIDEVLQILSREYRELKIGNIHRHLETSFELVWGGYVEIGLKGKTRHSRDLRK